LYLIFRCQSEGNSEVAAIEIFVEGNRS